MPRPGVSDRPWGVGLLKNPLTGSGRDSWGRWTPLACRWALVLVYFLRTLITNEEGDNSDRELLKPGALSERFPVFSFITLGHWGGGKWGVIS